MNVRIQTETKVADEIQLNQELEIRTLFGVCRFTVTEIDRDAGTATITSRRLVGWLKKREDGWYDQHCHGNLDAIERVYFV